MPILSTSFVKNNYSTCLYASRRWLEAWIGCSRSEKAATGRPWPADGWCGTACAAIRCGRTRSRVKNTRCWTRAARGCARASDTVTAASTASTFGPRVPEDAPEPVVVRSIAPGTCPECGSVRSKKNGVRYNKNYENQNYRCLDCGKHFSGNAALGNTVLPPPRTHGAGDGDGLLRHAVLQDGKVPGLERQTRMRENRVQYGPPLLQNPDRILRPAANRTCTA